MTRSSPPPEPKILLDGLAMVESLLARWPAVVRPLGYRRDQGSGPRRQERGHGPWTGRTRWTIDWLPDGRLLVTGNELLCVERDGSAVPYADLSDMGDLGWNDIVVDGRGNVYVTSIAFDYLAGKPPDAGIIVLVTPDGKSRKVAGGLKFPNGMVVTPDNSTLIIGESFNGRLTAFDIDAAGSLSNPRVWAEGLGPDAICMDTDGAIWTGTGDTRATTGREDSPGGAVARVREGGEELTRVEHDRSILGCALGGPDRRTLFLVATEWRGIDQLDNVLAARTGQVLTAPAPASGVGWP